tara:strand:- start:546 stop:1070 length:525 start_codon:yes stop_codon:yes gene_type:complete
LNKLTTISISTLTALATLTPGALAASDYNDHVTLGQVVRSTGINFKINPSTCWEKDSYGWYWAARNEMVICQEQKRSVGVEARWTEEDLDTLRHEAQHLIQDCMDGSRQGSLDAVYKEPIELAKDVIGSDGIRSILDAYSDSSDHIKVMELEAFSVAAMNDPLEQARDIQKFCF